LNSFLDSRSLAITGMELPAVRCRFAGMSSPETVAHVVILVLAVLGIFISLAGIAFWWVSRKMNRLT